MARVTTETGELVAEMIAPNIEIQWDPVTNGGQIAFHISKLVSMNGAVIACQSENRVMFSAIEHLMQRTFDVVTGQDSEGNPTTTPVPVPLLMGAVKTIFSTLYEEMLAEEAAAQAAALDSEPETTPDPAPEGGE